jgi:hypothetical protein
MLNANKTCEIYMKKTYTSSSRAWYMKDGFNRDILNEQQILDYLSICIELEDDKDSSYEFRIDFHQIGDSPVAKLNIFEDSWRAFTDIPDFFKALSSLDQQAPSIDDIEKVLKKLKFKDVTKLKNTFRA